MIYIPLQRQKPIHIFTKSLNQYPTIKAQTSDEVQPLEKYENCLAVFDDKLLSKRESNIDLLFGRGHRKNFYIYYLVQRYFHTPKNTIRNYSFVNNLYKQSLRDIILLFHDIAGLDMNLQE